MGGGLAFLLKKTWHPARPQNLEEKWKREQKAAEENRKADELRKQLDEERKNEDMMRIAEEAGYKREVRLDWMYQGGMAAKEDAAKRQDEHLLGLKPAQLNEPAGELSQAEVVSSLPSVGATAVPTSQNESWQRLNNDPLFMIKRQEQDQLKAIKTNPIKMQQILAEVARAKAAKEAKKAAKREKKELKRADKERHHRPAAGSDSDSDTPPPSRGPPHHAHPHHQQQHQHPQQRHERDSRDEQPGYRHHSHMPAGRTDRGQTLHHHHHRDADKHRPQDEHATNGRTDRMGRPTSTDDSRNREAPAQAQLKRPSSIRDSALPDHHDSHHGQRTRRPSRSPPSRRQRDDTDQGHQRSERRPEPVTGDQPRQQGDRTNGHHGHRHHSERAPSEEPGRPGERTATREEAGRSGDRSAGADATGPSGRREDAQAGSRSGYGLSHNSLAPAAVRGGAAAEQRAADTRSRLAESAANHEAALKEQATAQRHRRTEYKTGRMTEEERQKRLAEMMGNAEDHDVARSQRLAAAKAAAEAADVGSRIVSATGGGGGDGGRDAFVGAATREVFGAMANAGTSLESRVASRKHFQQR